MHYSIQITQRLKKLIRSLHQRPARDQNSLFVAEGEKVCYELIRSDYRAELIVVRDSPSSDVLDIVDVFTERGTAVYAAPKHLFDQLCQTKTPQGIMAVVNQKDQTIDSSQNFIALDGVSDPGNMGTIVRTAEWFGIKQILLSPECADPFGTKAVRSSMGSVFRINFHKADDLADSVKNLFPKTKLFTATLDTDNYLSKIKKPKTQFGLIFGSEAKGVSDALIKITDTPFKIQGNGIAESLNVAVSVGITLNHFAG